VSRKIIPIASSGHPIDGNVTHALRDDGPLWALHGNVRDALPPVPGSLIHARRGNKSGREPFINIALMARVTLTCLVFYAALS